MGEAEIHPDHDTIVISSHIITYGEAADEKLTALMRDEIETMWNEPKGIVYINGNKFMVTFSISAALQPSIDIEEICKIPTPEITIFGSRNMRMEIYLLWMGWVVTPVTLNWKIYTWVLQLLLMNMDTHLAWSIPMIWISGAKVFPASCIRGEH